MAVPLDVTFIGGTPGQQWGESVNLDPGFQDDIPVVNSGQTSSLNLAGVNTINLTWAAPAGYMYVVNPPPAGIVGNGDELFFQVAYGTFGQASSLGALSALNLSVNTVNGNAPWSPQVIFNPADGTGLYFAANGGMSAGSEPFAFTSLTISAGFNGTGADITLDQKASDEQEGMFGGLTGDFEKDGIGPFDYYVPPDPGPLITLEPLPSGSAPDVSSTLTLAGLGFSGLLFMGRKQKRLAVGC